MTVTVSAPDGSTVDFPDGTDAGVIHGAMMQHFGGGSPPPATLGQTALDVGKQLGVGATKGVAGLIGLPGDASSGLNNLLDWVDTKLGADPEKIAAARKIIDANSPAGTGDVMNTIQKVTGNLPDAETTPGKYAQTVGQFAPAALAGPEGVVANVGKLAVLPGMASEFLGQKTQGTWMEPIARIVGALGGGLAGSGISKGGEMLANRSAAKAAAGELGNIPPGAVNRVAKSYEADNLNPAAVAAKSADLGPEAMMLDMGRQMGGRAEAVASQPGAGQNTVLNAVEGRTGQFGAGTADRVSDTLDKVMGPTPDIVALRNKAVGTIGDTIDQHLGPSPDIVATKNAINTVVDQHAQPLYRAVMDAHPVVDVPASITNRPAVAQAMKDAVSLAKNHGEQLSSPTETQTILQGPGYHIADEVTPAAKTSLGYWDYVKKSLDSRINGMLKTGGIQDLNSADKADLGGLIAAKQALVSHLDNVTGGAYAVARKAAATKFEVNDAIDLGKSALNTKLLPEELADHMGSMSLPEQAGVKLGMRREMPRIIDTAQDDAGAARKMIETNQNGQKIAQVFGQPAADSLNRWIGLHDALDLGRSALNTKLLPEELIERMKTMGPVESTLLKGGMRRDIGRVMDTARNDGAAARRILDTNQNREKIASVFGQPAADAIDKRIAAETQFQDATNKISANSRTAVRSQLIKDTESPSVAAPPMANVGGIALAGLRRGAQFLSDQGMDRTRQGIADLVTRKGPAMSNLARVLSDYNQAKVANRATPFLPQAKSLAAVIAAQQPHTWANQGGQGQ